MLGMKLKVQEKGLSCSVKLYTVEQKPSLMFCKKMASAVNRIVSNLGVKKMLIVLFWLLKMLNQNAKLRLELYRQNGLGIWVILDLKFMMLL